MPGRIEILMELSKLRAVKVGGKWRLTEVSKKQRMILEKMEISMPVEANMVIKGAELRSYAGLASRERNMKCISAGPA